MGTFVQDFLGGKLFKGDKGVWMIYFFLCMISLVEVYSASSRLTFEGGPHWQPMVSQAGFLFAGLIIILLVHRIPCKWFMLFPFILLPVAILLLLWTAVLGGGSTVNSTNRWVDLFGVRFQPSEVAKAALLMTAAVVLAKTQTEKEEWVRGKKRKIVGAIKGKRYLAFSIVGSAALLICGLIFIDNVSTALMLFLVVVVMMFIGQVPKDLMFKGLAVILGIGALFAMTAIAVPESTWQDIPGCKRVVTVKHRLERKLHIGEKKGANVAQKTDKQTYLDDDNSQTTYASIAIANSDVIGVGPGNSVQRDFLQHAESDFIYAIIIEELGSPCPSFFPAYLVLGFGIMMVLQAFVNMSVAVGLIPVTGQTLPLISKGGTSILITSFYIGVILSVSRYAEKKELNAPLVEAVINGETSEYYTDGGMS